MADHARLSFILESVAFSGQGENVGMVQEPIQHGRRQRGIAAEGIGPLAERQVRSQDYRALLVVLGDHLEKQVGLLAPERQVANLVDHQ